jgi:hypothetical protein
MLQTVQICFLLFDLHSILSTIKSIWIPSGHQQKTSFHKQWCLPNNSQKQINNFVKAIFTNHLCIQLETRKTNSSIDKLMFSEKKTPLIISAPNFHHWTHKPVNVINIWFVERAKKKTCQHIYWPLIPLIGDNLMTTQATTSSTVSLAKKFLITKA